MCPLCRGQQVMTCEDHNNLKRSFAKCGTLWLPSPARGPRTTPDIVLLAMEDLAAGLSCFYRWASRNPLMSCFSRWSRRASEERTVNVYGAEWFAWCCALNSFSPNTNGNRPTILMASSRAR